MIYLTLSFVTYASVTLAASLTISRDGSCGGRRGYTCVGSAFGNCCSQYGYCGRTDAYCGTGCQSQYGTCGLQSLKPSTPSPTTRQSALPSSTQLVSNNARCGKDFGGRTCMGSQWGKCCSQYSYCGSTSDYCMPETCQKGYGSCDAIPSSSSRLLTSTARSSSSSSRSSSTLPLSMPTSSGFTTKTSASSTTSAAFTSVSSSTKLSSSTFGLPTGSSASISATTSASLVSSSSILASSPISSSTPSSSPSSTPVPQVTPTPTPSQPPSSSAPVGPCATNLLQNSGFDSGSLTPWTTTGTTIQVLANNGPSGSSQSGAYYIGSSGETNFGIRQRLTGIPAGTPLLCGFWHRYITTAYLDIVAVQMYIDGQLCAGIADDLGGSNNWEEYSYGAITVLTADPVISVDVTLNTYGGRNPFVAVDSISVIRTDGFPVGTGGC